MSLPIYAAERLLAANAELAALVKEVKGAAREAAGEARIAPISVGPLSHPSPTSGTSACWPSG